MDFASVLRYHATKYPRLTPQDVVKLVYQSAYGCLHFVDAGRAEAYISEEMQGTEKTDEPLFEPIGNGRARLMLTSRMAKELSPSLIAKIFATSAKWDARLNAVEDKFEEYISVFQSEAKNGLFAFSHVDAVAFLDKYRAIGGGAVHHSEDYRKSYAPAYRVFSPVAVKTLEACKLADNLFLGGTEPIFALCGDDKATLEDAKAFVNAVFDGAVRFGSENCNAEFALNTIGVFEKVK